MVDGNEIEPDYQESGSTSTYCILITDLVARCSRKANVSQTPDLLMVTSSKVEARKPGPVNCSDLGGQPCAGPPFDGPQRPGNERNPPVVQV